VDVTGSIDLIQNNLLGRIQDSNINKGFKYFVESLQDLVSYSLKWIKICAREYFILNGLTVFLILNSLILDQIWSTLVKATLWAVL